MKKKIIVEVNLGNYGSTGNIMKGISDEAEKKGYVVYQAYPQNAQNLPAQKQDIVICPSWYLKITRSLAMYTGYNGCFSILATLLFLRKVKKVNPSAFHFHNLHDSYINLPLLFRYIKKHKIPVIWTLHDCWAFTGRCPHFVSIPCYKWKGAGCSSCPQLNTYPITKRDRSKYLWEHKKHWFTKIDNLQIITPSQWLADFVKQSFLKDYPISVINNGIDLNIFRPTKSDFRQNNSLESKYIILGVAYGWGKKKGLDVFIELSKRLDNRFQIVLVGTNKEIDKIIPNDIISIHNTHDQHELAELYSVADLFVNPSREENYPTVNMEAIACGTPVLTFRTGGSPEIVDDKTGYVVDIDDIDEMEKQIVRICTNKTFTLEDCLKRSKAFDKYLKYQEYIDLYE
ncbi:glycosyltransferase [Ruminococcus flavefaciens]|uniref:glycosyltransferase n=1 Tax=Ruminococcus flavefaciens TaxID=1265 RepID=UPI0004AC9B32|nr:glycosyltransferase [Ruminococcus flavefaciens]